METPTTVPLEYANRVSRRTALCALATILFLFITPELAAQKMPPGTTAAAPTDSSAQASPVHGAVSEPATDTSADASPISPARIGSAGIASHTALPVRLNEGIDSGKLKNGQNVHGKLASAVKTGSRLLPAGTPVLLTVIATVPAGRIASAGEFSLELVRVGAVDVATEVQTFHGQHGAKDLPDSAPALGLDAGLAAGAALTFHVQPPPTAASGPPRNEGITPGSVTGVASGGPPPAGSAQQPGSANGTPTIRSGSPPGRPEPAQHPADNAGGAVRTGASSSQPTTPQPAPAAPR